MSMAAGWRSEAAYEINLATSEPYVVIPAKAGNPGPTPRRRSWTAAFAGVTGNVLILACVITSPSLRFARCDPWRRSMIRSAVREARPSADNTRRCRWGCTSGTAAGATRDARAQSRERLGRRQRAENSRQQMDPLVGARTHEINTRSSAFWPLFSQTNIAAPGRAPRDSCRPRHRILCQAPTF